VERISLYDETLRDGATTAPMKFLNFLPKEALFYNMIHDLVMDAHKSSRALHA
jgi:hypothetical protein